ncbi:hypothetical protein M3C58_14880 [Brachybacterium muris]|uniref:hypothetical protein n=1 Tax=Brachybacterium muris TaxID=219301 RepID=UPI0021A7DC09|nr:hypothetical protein [Brachybacterium muris]MCT1999450.1 hypothetical protein [Brachybacterium muris]
MKRFLFISGLAIGFVVGSRMGRGPYESLERNAREIVEDPEVQRKAAQARDTAGKAAQDAAETVKEKAPVVAETAKAKAADLADTAKDKASEAKGKASEKKAEKDAAKTEDELSESSEDTAAAGGDAEVGEDRPLSS